MADPQGQLPERPAVLLRDHRGGRLGDVDRVGEGVAQARGGLADAPQGHDERRGAAPAGNLHRPKVRDGYQLTDTPTGLRLSGVGDVVAERPGGWTPKTHPSMLRLEVTLDPSNQADRQMLLDVLDQLYFAAVYFETDVMIEFLGTATRPQPRMASQEWRALAKTFHGDRGTKGAVSVPLSQLLDLPPLSSRDRPLDQENQVVQPNQAEQILFFPTNLDEQAGPYTPAARSVDGIAPAPAAGHHPGTGYRCRRPDGDVQHVEHG